MPKHDIRDLKLLVIDDNAEARTMMREMLTSIGITQIFEAKNGREGLQFIDAAFDFVDIIICDWNMPSMSGISLLKQLRTVDSEFPFMMVTGRSDIGSVSEAKSAGVSGYILKPFSPAQLETKLRIVATRSRILDN